MIAALNLLQQLTQTLQLTAFPVVIIHKKLRSITDLTESHKPRQDFDFAAIDFLLRCMENSLLHLLEQG